VPFWFVIINNHLPEIKIPPGVPKYVSRILLQILLLFNIAGFLIVISAVFVKAFTEQASTGYLVLNIIILILIMTISIYGILTLIRGAYFEQRILIVGLLYFLVSLVGIFRASVQTPFLLLNIYQIITVLIFGLSAKKTLNSKPQLFMRYVFTGLVFYLGANVLFHLVGMENQTEIYLKKFDSVMLSLIGIETSRVYYPLAEGINPFGMVGGAGFVMSVAMGITMIKNRSKDIISWIMITLGVSFSFYIILFTFLLPMIRSNSDVLSGRGVIWQAGIEQLSTFNWIHLIGYGLSGQTVSGVVDKYNHLFVSYIYTNRVSLHHFGLQTIYDFGYLGLLLAYSLMFLMGITLIRRIRAYPDNQEAFLAFAFLLYIILAGSVSTIPAFYARELFVIFIFVWVATGMNPRENYAS
jgi:hypothetical protein